MYVSPPPISMGVYIEYMQYVDIHGIDGDYAITYLWTYYLSKVGIRKLSPHLRNSAILRLTKSIAELRTKKSCGTVIADLQNLTSAIPQLSAVSSQSATFLSLFLSSGWF